MEKTSKVTEFINPAPLNHIRKCHIHVSLSGGGMGTTWISFGEPRLKALKLKAAPGSGPWSLELSQQEC